MPPTKHMEGDIFFSHVYDSIFNLVSVLTNGIQIDAPMRAETGAAHALASRLLAISAMMSSASKDARASVHSSRRGGLIR